MTSPPADSNLTASETILPAPELECIVIPDEMYESFADPAYAIFLDDPEGPDYEFDEDIMDEEDRTKPVNQIAFVALRKASAKVQECQ